MPPEGNPMSDRLFSIKTVVQAAGLLVIATACGLGFNAVRGSSEKQIALDRQYFKKQVMEREAARRAQDGDAGTTNPPQNPGTTDPRTPEVTQPVNGTGTTEPAIPDVGTTDPDTNPPDAGTTRRADTGPVASVAYNADADRFQHLFMEAFARR